MGYRGSDVIWTTPPRSRSMTGGYRDSDGIWTTPQKVIVRSWSRSKSGQGQIYVTKSMTVTIYARTV